MFAVIKTGGKQYRVVAEDILQVDRVDAEPGSVIEFGEVLVVGGDTPVLGLPTVAGATVAAEVLDHVRGAEGHRLQEAPPQEFAAQARPPAGILAGADHRDPHRGQEAVADPAAAAEARAEGRGRSRRATAKRRSNAA